VEKEPIEGELVRDGVGAAEAVDVDGLALRLLAVARGADAPSRPVPDAVRHELRDAWEDDLDVPAVLGVLDRLERGDELPPGALFETFVYADRLLGLELARDVGRTP